MMCGPKSLLEELSSCRGVAEPAKPAQPSVIAINSKGIEGILYVENDFRGANPAVLRLMVTNNNPVPVENFVFQAAVTKVPVLF